VTNGNGTGVDLTGPLAGMWRDVYRKAAEVAEGRTAEHLKSHVYVYHPNGAGGGGGGGEDTGPWVDEAGDTMTGTLRFAGVDATADGAVVVYGVTSTAGHLYGPDSPPYAPDAVLAADDEWGVRFAVSATRYLVALRWYRTHAAMPPPGAVRLWDSTAPGAPLATWSAYPAFADPALGWKEHALPTAEQAALEPLRQYTLSYTPGSSAQQGQVSYTPVPVAGLTLVGFYRNATPGQYPDLGAISTSIDGDFRESQAADPAGSGAIRLPNGAPGVIAWRNAANSGDHTLTVDASDQLVFDGVPLGGGGGGTGNTTMYTQTGTPTGATNSLWFNPSESA
jgi:hypothetical protein